MGNEITYTYERPSGFQTSTTYYTPTPPPPPVTHHHTTVYETTHVQPTPPVVYVQSGYSPYVMPPIPPIPPIPPMHTYGTSVHTVTHAPTESLTFGPAGIHYHQSTPGVTVTTTTQPQPRVTARTVRTTVYRDNTDAFW
ncbi:MAG: hypothetical protein Edafosvirus6_10 [Edafosvirus sp.]|uniref:Uncharacterized protein n=1 Tax=Edafosvirus sp. TaxID=2487765 RepID=A0A3G4ZVY6_9VIRU|nr:MAG: hypothetical protein Edafosvirus6_10 [Edafosvirus sp.]